MMSELIKMSLFCDTEMFTEHTLDQQTDERTVSSHETFSLEQEMTSCNGNSAMLRAVSHFLSTTLKAKVDVSTFSNVHPDSIFGNDYLQPIVEAIKTEESGNVRSGKKPEVTKSKMRHDETRTFPTQPPYSYRAMVCAAIYLSDLELVRKKDVIDSIKNMFEVFRIDDLEWQKRWQRNVLKGSDWEKKTIIRKAGVLGLRYEAIDLAVFKKAVFKKEMDKYADDLFTEIGIPEKLEELRNVVKKTKKETSHRKKAMTMSTPEVIENCPNPRLSSTTKSEENDRKKTMTAIPPEETEKCYRLILPSKPTSEESQRKNATTNSSPEVTEKCSSLRLPSRPCFNDDSSNDSLLLSMTATHNGSEHALTTVLPAFSATLSPQIPCFTPTVYNVPYISVPTWYWQAL